jgi:hypothetical protein
MACLIDYFIDPHVLRIVSHYLSTFVRTALYLRNPYHVQVPPLRDSWLEDMLCYWPSEDK